MRRYLTLIVAAVAALVAMSAPETLGQASVRVLPVRANVFLIAGAGANVTLQIGKQGVLLVDAPQPSLAAQVLAEIRKLSTAPIRYIISTSADRDHTAGNEALAGSGAPGVGGPALAPTQLFAIGSAQGMSIIAHEKVLDRMTSSNAGDEPAPSRAALPTSTYVQGTKDFSFNGEPVIVHHVPAAHTDGDSIVMLRSSDVVSTGDVFAPDRYPMIDVARGGSVQGIIDGLNLVLALTVPEAFQEGGTKVIPGHGRLSEEADVVEYRDMVWIVRDRIADLIKKRMTLAQIKAAKPTSDYDGGYDSPAVRADAFVESVYASLTAKR